MKPRIDSGVSAYVIGTATVKASFPIDFHGNPYVCCALCVFYRPSSRRCSLTDAVCEYPDKYIGSQCPLDFDKEDK